MVHNTKFNIIAKYNNTQHLTNMLFLFFLFSITLFFLLFKIIQFTLSVTDFAIIQESCNGPISVSFWLIVSSVFGLIIYFYFFQKLVHVYKTTDNQNYQSDAITKITTSILFTQQFIWTIIGFEIYNRGCDNTSSYLAENSEHLVFTSLIVDMLELVFIVSVILYCYRNTTSQYIPIQTNDSSNNVSNFDF